MRGPKLKTRLWHLFRKKQKKGGKARKPEKERKTSQSDKPLQDLCKT